VYIKFKVGYLPMSPTKNQEKNFELLLQSLKISKKGIEQAYQDGVKCFDDFVNIDDDEAADRLKDKKLLSVWKSICDDLANLMVANDEDKTFANIRSRYCNKRSCRVSSDATPIPETPETSPKRKPHTVVADASPIDQDPRPHKRPPSTVVEPVTPSEHDGTDEEVFQEDTTHGRKN